MYKDFFGIQQKPFSIAPDPHFLFMSHGHRDALAHLRYGLEEEGGFVLLTGEVGTGKTTVCRCLLESVPETTAIAFILQPKLSSLELLEAICKEFGLDYSGRSTVRDLVDLLYEFLLVVHGTGKNAALIIDEAQNLGIDTLEQIRLLTNLETNEKKLLQIILLGQPELAAKLQQPELLQLGQRISARCHLGPLTARDTREYVLHRLAVARMGADVFSAASLKALFRVTAGIPRLINTVCDRALLAAYSKGVRRIDKSLLVSAAREVLGEKERLSLPFVPRWVVGGVTIAVCLVLVGLIRSISPPAAENVLTAKQSRPPMIAGPSVDGLEKVEEYIASPAASKAVNTVAAKKPVWPLGKQTQTTEDAAFVSLLRQWGVGTPPKGQWPCQFVEEKGLRCIAKHGDLETLLTLDRPAVLRMKNEQGAVFFAAMLKTSGDEASLEINGEASQVALSDLTRGWFGDFVLIWQPPPGYTGSMRTGSRGPVVSWLSDRLAKIDGTEYSGSKGRNVFGAEHVRAVKHLQDTHHLVTDGIAGKETLIIVNSLSGAKVPHLKENR